MIYSLTGKYVAAEPNFVVIDCGGVGFQCFTSMSTITRLPQQGSTVTLYTYMSVTIRRGLNISCAMSCICAGDISSIWANSWLMFFSLSR